MRARYGVSFDNLKSDLYSASVNAVVWEISYYTRPLYNGIVYQPVSMAIIHKLFRPLNPTIRVTHWGRVMHICVNKLTTIGSDNGLSPAWGQAIIWTNAGILLIRPLGTNFSEILVEILIFSFKKMRLKVLSAKRRPFCLGLNEVIVDLSVTHFRRGQINHPF